jgi:HAD superfamily hydrolase (TIGR01509 family)
MHMLAMRGIDDDDVAERLTDEALRLWDAQHEEHHSLVPGISAVLAELKKQNIATAVVSNASHKRIETDLAQVGLREYFSTLVGRDDVSAHKPHPEPYETALRLLNVHAKDCVAFEDSPTGVESAYLAGITVVGLLTTFHAEDLTKAAKLIRDFRGLTIGDLTLLL